MARLHSDVRFAPGYSDGSSFDGIRTVTAFIRGYDPLYRWPRRGRNRFDTIVRPGERIEHDWKHGGDLLVWHVDGNDVPVSQHCDFENHCFRADFAGGRHLFYFQRGCHAPDVHGRKDREPRFSWSDDVVPCHKQPVHIFDRRDKGHNLYFVVPEKAVSRVACSSWLSNWAAEFDAANAASGHPEAATLDIWSKFRVKFRL